MNSSKQLAVAPMISADHPSSCVQQASLRNRRKSKERKREQQGKDKGQDNEWTKDSERKQTNENEWKGKAKAREMETKKESINTNRNHLRIQSLEGTQIDSYHFDIMRNRQDSCYLEYVIGGHRFSKSEESWGKRWDRPKSDALRLHASTTTDVRCAR